MKQNIFSKKNQLDEMQEQTLRKIESRGFLLPGRCIFMQGISRVLSLALAPLDFILRAGC